MSEEVEKFLPDFIEGLVKHSWNKKSDFFKRKINFASYRKGYFDAFEQLELIKDG